MPILNILGTSTMIERVGNWQPTLTAHDPNPPLTLLNPSASAFNVAWSIAANSLIQPGALQA